MDLLEDAVLDLGSDGGTFLRVRDAPVIGVEPERRRGFVAHEAENALQTQTELLGCEGLLDDRVAAAMRAMGLLVCLEAAPHEQHADVGTHSNDATCELAATHALHVGGGDQGMDLEPRRPAEALARRAVGGVEHTVPLLAEGADERDPVVGVVVDQQNTAEVLEGRQRSSHGLKSQTA
jgi:hypothetical protein